MTNNQNIQLFTKIQIWYHKHILHLIFIFIITGTPLISSKMAWLAFLFGVPFAVSPDVNSYQEIVVMGIQTCRIIHRFMAVLWIVTSIPFIFNMLPKIRNWDISCKKTDNQCCGEYVKNGIADLKTTYIEWKYPKYMGKYNIAQVAASWGIIAICLLMMASGCVLWVRAYLPDGLTSIMGLLHLLGFYTMIMFLILHIYFAVHPVNRAGYTAMFGDGMDTKDHAKKKHPALFAKSTKP